MDLETLTYRKAAECGMDIHAVHPVDRARVVPIIAGSYAFQCSLAAAKIQGRAGMIQRVAELVEHRDITAQQHAFAAWIVEECERIAAAHPAVPGDAIQEAFEWTGWCHRIWHGAATGARIRLVGAPELAPSQRAAGRERIGDTLMQEFRTQDALFVAHYAAEQRDGSRWERRWNEAYAKTMAAAFDGNPPAGVSARFTFTCSPF